MSKSLRLSEKWFHRGLWLVAIVFASFLIGLGATIVRNMPLVEKNYALDEFIDKDSAGKARQAIKEAQAAGKAAQEALDQAELKLSVAAADSGSARETFTNWLASRRVTERAEQDPEVLSRTKALDTLKARERQALSAVEAQKQVALDARQAEARAQAQLRELERAAGEAMQSAQRRQDLRVFLYRLAFILPLLVAAGWLLSRKRKSTYWPFVWGFVLFALFTFFVELVPYLPSYGGYVRYLVGIIITVLVGRQAILALNRYLERQKQAERLPDAQRREELSYDVALSRLTKGVCPGCERQVDLKDPAIDFCPHCGIALHNHCAQCNARKRAFAKFCHACGTSSATLPN